MKCIYCNKKDIYKILDFGKMPVSNNLLRKKELRNQKKYDLILFLCKNCKLVQIKNNVKSSDIFNKNYLYYSSYSQSWINHCKKLVNKLILNYKLNKSSLIIEIASNDGYLLNLFKKKKISTIGIEPSSSVNKIAKKKGLITINNFFSYKLIKENLVLNNSNVIIGLNVLAHTPNLLDFIKALNQIISRKTVAIFEIQYLGKMVENLLFDTIYHEHYSYFSMTSLKNLFKNFEIDIFDYEFIKTHGGSIRIFIKRKNLITKKQNKKINDLLKIEKQKGMCEEEYYKKFAKQTKKEIEKFKLSVKKFTFNKNVYGYGAPAKTTIFCNLVKIENNQLIKIFDKNPFKQKRYIPGVNIPIISPEKIRSLKPKYIIVFPRNLVNEIKKQLNFIKKWKGKLLIFKKDLEQIKF